MVREPRSNVGVVEGVGSVRGCWGEFEIYMAMGRRVRGCGDFQIG